MTYYITRLIDGRYKYYWNIAKRQWEGLRNNGSGFKDQGEAIKYMQQQTYDSKVEPINRPVLN